MTDTTTPGDADVISIQNAGDDMTVTVHTPTLGEVEAAVFSRVTREALAARSTPPGRVAVELANVKMMTSMGIGALIVLRTSAMQRGATFTLVNVSKESQEILGFLKLDQLLK